MFPGAETEHGILDLGYVIHPGVSSQPPYFRMTHLASSIHVMLAAYNWFKSVVYSSKVCVVFSSFAWDLARRFSYFPQQREGDWLHAYRVNFTDAARVLRKTADALVLVADYGCRTAQGYNNTKWTDSMLQHFC